MMKAKIQKDEVLPEQSDSNYLDQIRELIIGKFQTSWQSEFQRLEKLISDLGEKTEQRLAILEKKIDSVHSDSTSSTTDLNKKVTQIRDDLQSNLTELKNEVHDKVTRLGKEKVDKDSIGQAFASWAMQFQNGLDAIATQKDE